MTRPNLALIHGWGLNRTVWPMQCIDALESRCNLHLLDLPGYGDTPYAGESFDDTAQTFADMLPTGITLCGWSLGGLLALRAALLVPERIARLVLVGTTPRFTQAEGWNDAQPESILNGFSTALADNPRSTLQRFVALLNQGDQQARTIGREFNRSLLSFPVPADKSLLAGLDWLRNVDLRQQISDIACPVLIIHGDHDPLMPIRAAYWMKDRLRDARLIAFPETAHAPFASHPEPFGRLVGDFLHATNNN